MGNNIRKYQGITPTIGKNVYVDESAVIIGDVEIGYDSSIWCTTVIRGDVNSIRIGSRTNIQDASVLHVTHKSEANPAGYPLTIGDNVTIGHRVTLHGCTLDDYCFIGMNAVIMDDAHVATDVIVGAGALVTQGAKLESGYLYIGAPAKRARKLTDAEIAMVHKSSQNYVNYAQNYLND